MAPTRRQILAGLALPAALACRPARAQTFNDLLKRGVDVTKAEPLVLRRAPREGEDRDWYALGQRGPHLASPSPITIPFGQGRVVVHWPRDLPEARMVVFSHGALATPLLYRTLLQHWASHGFVVVAPVHDDSIQERGLLTRRATGVGSAVWEVDRILNDVLAWSQRVEQCGIALEHHALIGKAIGMRVLEDRPIIAGHDFGAYVAQLVLGTKVASQGDRPFRPADPRWFGGIAMSPQGPGVMGLSDDSWVEVDRPLLVVEAALEQDSLGQGARDKVAAYERSRPGYKHLAWFANGPRTIYAGNQAVLSETDLDVRMFEDVKSATTAFLKAYGGYDAATYGRLYGPWPEAGSEGRMAWRSR